MSKLHGLFSQYNQQTLKADKFENSKFTAKSDDDNDCCCTSCCCNDDCKRICFWTGTLCEEFG